MIALIPYGVEILRAEARVRILIAEQERAMFKALRADLPPPVVCDYCGSRHAEDRCGSCGAPRRA